MWNVTNIGRYLIDKVKIGYKKFGGDPSLPTKISRQYNGLIGHYAVRIKAKIFKIDSYSNESIFVMVDNVASKIYTFQQSNSTQ